MAFSLYIQCDRVCESQGETRRTKSCPLLPQTEGNQDILLDAFRRWQVSSDTPRIVRWVADVFTREADTEEIDMIGGAM